ncbi:MAG: cyclic nucleotide-binding domain-containing protein [Pseudomonadota bacterium]|nr:cyclic nucleotide-binding domain-containing protein [Pseudomonadota bacterium]
MSEYLEEVLVDAGVPVCRLAPSETVFEEGDRGDAAYFIRTGSIDITSKGLDGTERLLNRLGSGEIFGEMALLDETRRSASASASTSAREPTELFVISRGKVVELLHEVPEMALWLLKLSSHRLRVLTHKVAEMEQVHEVNLKILAGQERERRRIGRDIHDGVGHLFSDYILRLQMAELALSQDLEKTRSELADLQVGLREGLEKLRELVYNLYPKELCRVGLVGAIERFVDRIAQSADMEVAFESHDLDLELPAALEATLYCIVQEALNNAKKHARASRVSVELRCEGTRLTLDIADDGCGFDVNERLRDRLNHDAFGLLSMEERTKLAGGAMEIESHPGAGTKLRFFVPVPACR